MSSKTIKIIDSGGKILYEGNCRRMNSNGNSNGTSKLIFWIMTFVCALLVTIGLGWTNRIQAAQDQHTVILAARGERISILETHYNTIANDLNDIKIDIKDIRKKLYIEK